MASSDEELVARSMGGDLDSFNQLVLRWERPIYALAYRVIGRDEERDVAQDLSPGVSRPPGSRACEISSVSTDTLTRAATDAQRAGARRSSAGRVDIRAAGGPPRETIEEEGRAEGDWQGREQSLATRLKSAHRDI